MEESKNDTIAAGAAAADMTVFQRFDAGARTEKEAGIWSNRR